MPKAIEAAQLQHNPILQIMEQVAKTGQPITVNLAEDSYVQIVPAPRMHPLWGCMKGTGEIVGDVMAPIEETWHARDLDRFE